MSGTNGNATNHKQAHMSDGIVLLTEQNQNIEQLYNSVIVSQLSAMAKAEEKGDFSFLVFGSEHQDDLETERAINLNKIRSENAGLADKMMNFLKSAESKYKGTDYEFSINQDKDGHLVVPYIAFPVVANRIVNECSKPEAISLLGLLQESLTNKNKERAQKASSTGWVMFFVGLGTSGMTLVGLVAPNVIGNLSASLAGGLQVMGYVSLGVTCVLTTVGVAGKIKKAIRKNELTAQSSTIASSLANAQSMLENIKAKNSEDLKRATENVGKNIAGHALMSLEEQNKKRARQNNNNNAVLKKNIQSASSGQNVGNANVVMPSPISAPVQQMPVATNNVLPYPNFNPQQPNVASNLGAFNGLFGNGAHNGHVHQPTYAVIGNNAYNGSIANNNIISNDNKQSQNQAQRKQSVEEKANIKENREENNKKNNLKDNLEDNGNESKTDKGSVVLPNEKKTSEKQQDVKQPSEKQAEKTGDQDDLGVFAKKQSSLQEEKEKTKEAKVPKTDNTSKNNNKSNQEVANLYIPEHKKINTTSNVVSTKTNNTEINLGNQN